MVNEKCLKYGSQGSAIRELFEYGKKRKAIVGEDRVFDFSLGNPNVVTPADYQKTLIRILEEKDPVSVHGYTSAVGDMEARKAIADQLNGKYGASLSPDYIYLTCGAAAGLVITLKALVSSPEDEVIVNAPFFPEYSVFIESAGAKRVIAMPDENMLPDFEDLKRKISRNTRCIIINSPNNPTGVVYDEEVLRKLSALVTEKEKEYAHPIVILSDEPYRELIFSEKKYPFLTRFYRDSVVVYSFSKSLSLPGERIGYIAVNPEMENAREVYDAVKGAGRMLGYVCAPSLFQYSVTEAVKNLCDLDFYRINREVLYEGLTGLGYQVIYPEGAFYMFVRSPEEDATAFMEKAKKHDLLIVPSDSFGIPGYVRIAYCVKKETIVNSLPAFAELMKEYRG